MLNPLLKLYELVLEAKKFGEIGVAVEPSEGFVRTHHLGNRNVGAHSAATMPSLPIAIALRAIVGLPRSERWIGPPPDRTAGFAFRRLPPEG